MKDIIQKRLEIFDLKNSEDEINALKEITQEVALYSLKKVGFFEEVCFLGGTCLRIVHGLDRFSEDLDFATRKTNSAFNLDYYLEKAMDIMSPYGYDLSINTKDLDDRTIQSRFLKDDSIKKVLTFKYSQDLRKKIKIKIEVDTRPPIGAVQKIEYVDFPIDFQIASYDIPSLMTGKIHALLCRPYDKGRDWYDFSWYIKNGSFLNLEFLKNSLFQMGPWAGENIEISPSFVKKELSKKISSINWSEIKEDVRGFLNSEKAETLDLWSEDFFQSKLKRLK